MSDRQYRTTDDSVSPAAKTTLAIAVVASLFALLVALSYPGLAAAAGLGGLTAVGTWRVAALLRAVDGICIPGTDICLRPPSA